MLARIKKNKSIFKKAVSKGGRLGQLLHENKYKWVAFVPLLCYNITIIQTGGLTYYETTDLQSFSPPVGVHPGR